MWLVSLVAVLSAALCSPSNRSVWSRKVLFLSVSFHTKYTITPAFSLPVIIRICLSWDHFIDTCRMWMPPDTPRDSWAFSWLWLSLHLLDVNSFPKGKPQGGSKETAFTRAPSWHSGKGIVQVLSVFNAQVTAQTSFGIGALWRGCPGRVHLPPQPHGADNVNGKKLSGNRGTEFSVDEFGLGDLPSFRAAYVSS